jgi:hypothetical protein
MKKQSWVWWLVLVAIIVLIWRWWAGDRPGSAEAQAEDPRLAIGRVWIDSKPDKLTDYVHAVLLVDGAPVGLFQKASAYDVHLELFDYRRDGKTLDLEFLQTQKRHKIGYKVTRCDDLPPFDLCLTLSKNPWGGPKRYHGLRDQQAEAAALPGVRARLLQAATR